MDQSRRNWLLTAGAAGAMSASWLEELVGSRNEAAANEPDTSETVRILYNENPLGCSPQARDALSKVPTQFYGFSNTRKLIDELRNRHGLGGLPGVDSISIRGDDTAGDYTLTLGVGSTEILKALAQAYCQQAGSVVEPDPSYRAVGRAAQAVNPDTVVRRIPLQPDGSLDLQAMANATDARTRIVVLTNPNNPTGGVSKKSEVTKFIESVPESAIVLADEAYIDFVDENQVSAIELAKTKKNVLVTRTFSKLHGLAGLRLGYGIGHTALIERLRPFQLGVMGINSAATAACLASLRDKSHQAATRKMVRSFLETMSSELPKFGFRVLPSSAPFVWAEWKQDATGLVEKLAAAGVLISGGARWERPSWVRISAGTPTQCERLLAGIQNAV